MRVLQRVFRAVVLAFGLVAAPGLSSPGAAQGRSAEDTKTIEEYRITMPMLRKTLPAMYALGTTRCEERRRTDPHALSLDEMTRKLEACSPVMQSLRQAGVKPGDAALLYAALLHTARELGRRGGQSAALPPGVTRDNAVLLEQNDAEIRKLTKTGGQS
jgi:hypothetical protein